MFETVAAALEEVVWQCMSVSKCVSGMLPSVHFMFQEEGVRVERDAVHEYKDPYVPC